MINKNTELKRANRNSNYSSKESKKKKKTRKAPKQGKHENSDFTHSSMPNKIK